MFKKIDLEYPIDHLDMTVRVTKLLRNNGVFTIRDLTQKTDTQLLNISGFGIHCLEQVRLCLGYTGLKTSMTAIERRNYTHKTLLDKIEEVISILESAKNTLISSDADKQKSSE